MEFETESRLVIGAAITVHRELGPGLLESVYQRCLDMELTQLGLSVKREVPVPLYYRGQSLGEHYRVDLVVNGCLVVEVKSVARLEGVHRAQLMTYLRLTGIRVGLLFNFNTAVLKDGLVRIVL